MNLTYSVLEPKNRGLGGTPGRVSRTVGGDGKRTVRAIGPHNLWFSAALGTRLGEQAMARDGISGGDIGRK